MVARLCEGGPHPPSTIEGKAENQMAAVGGKRKAERENRY